MGREGRKKVMERFTVQVCGPRVYSILERVMNQ
jgi:hypothetical protein